MCDWFKVVEKYPFKYTQQADLLVVWHADVLLLVHFKFSFFFVIFVKQL